MKEGISGLLLAIIFLGPLVYAAIIMGPYFFVPFIGIMILYLFSRN